VWNDKEFKHLALFDSFSPF